MLLLPPPRNRRPPPRRRRRNRHRSLPTPPPYCRGAARAEEGGKADQGGSQARRHGVCQGAPGSRGSLRPGGGVAAAATPAPPPEPPIDRPTRPTPRTHTLPPLPPPPPLQILAKELVTMRRTVTKLAVNKANLMALSNQMTEQLGEWSFAAPSLSIPLHSRSCCVSVPLCIPCCCRRRVVPLADAPRLLPHRRCSDDAGGGRAVQERRGAEAGEQPGQGAAAAAHHGGDGSRCAWQAGRGDEMGRGGSSHMCGRVCWVGG